MRSFTSDKTVNFNTIPINKQSWNSSRDLESRIHKIHAYPAKFPAFLTKKAIQFARLKGLTPNTIADIFCGCGTVALEARKEGLDFWGCDINPVATLIAEVKSTRYNTELLKRYYQSIIDAYGKANVVVEYSKANKRIQYWFKENSYNDLFKLKQSILKVKYKNKAYQKFFLCAFSNILKSTSRWLTKSIKPQIDPNKIEKNVLQSFKKQIKFMLKAIQENDINTSTQSIIKTNSILNKNMNIPKVDMIVTSPPYVTSYEYADLHQLSSLWLDFTNDYTKLRKGTIGSVYHIENYDIDNNKRKINEVGQKIIKELEKQDHSKAKSVTRYFYDMQEVVRRAVDILNDGGMAFFVIGNTKYKGVKVDNVKHLHESMKNVGFSKFYMGKRKITNKILTPYRDSVGKFTANKKSRKIYSEEFILIGEK